MTLGGALLVTLVLGVFAFLLADAQREDRREVERRFLDIAQISAAVTNGIFEASLSGTRQQISLRLAGEEIETSALESLARRARLTYAVVLNARGRRLAETAQAPPVRERSDAVRTAIDANEPRMSDVIVRGPQSVIEWAIPYPASSGRRIYVQAIPTAAFAEFLATSLGRLPNFANAETAMVDSEGIVLGGSRLGTPVGTRHEDADLLEALATRDHGEYGDDRYFAAGSIDGSPFRIVLSTTDSRLYDTISGARRTIPWIIFAAFALAALAGLYLLRRASMAAAEIERRELNEKHAVEINDNIIQGLALAKYQLQAGEGAASAEQVSETLREAQRLVSSLLGEAEVRAGQLRRDRAAETTRPEVSAGDEQAT